MESLNVFKISSESLSCRVVAFPATLLQQGRVGTLLQRQSNGRAHDCLMITTFRGPIVFL